MKEHKFDIVIIGGGCVALFLAHQLVEKYSSLKIAIIEKEATLGKHSSGRNSGVLHAGIYYKPYTQKAKVCVQGSKRLKEWCYRQNINVKECGKLVVPQEERLDKQIDILAERAASNGAEVEIINELKLQQLFPGSTTATNRALWSPYTSVVNPKDVIDVLHKDLCMKGVKFFLNETNWEVSPQEQLISLTKGQQLRYGHIFNCAGLFADKVANKFLIGKDYSLIPFKGIYWEFKTEEVIHVPCNLYPVPDLELPFLGVHITPSASSHKIAYVGPTATPALGRENYEGLEKLDIPLSINNFLLLAEQYVKDKGKFRMYTKEQLLLFFKPIMLRELKKLVPDINGASIVKSTKVGIRSQLFNKKTKQLEDDFICISKAASTHILNAISPAFTSSFEFADLIINHSKFRGK